MFFPKKTQKLLTRFAGLATSGHHNSAMITDRRKFTAKLTIYGMFSLYFTIGINSKSFLWPIHSVQETSPNFL